MIGVHKRDGLCASSKMPCIYKGSAQPWGLSSRRQSRRNSTQMVCPSLSTIRAVKLLPIVNGTNDHSADGFVVQHDCCAVLKPLHRAHSFTDGRFPFWRRPPTSRQGPAVRPHSVRLSRAYFRQQTDACGVDYRSRQGHCPEPLDHPAPNQTRSFGPRRTTEFLSVSFTLVPVARMDTAI